MEAKGFDMKARETGASGQIRIAAIVIVITMVLWMLASWFGGMAGLPLRFALLFDLAALAAFVWALVVVFGVWRDSQRARQKGE